MVVKQITLLQIRDMSYRKLVDVQHTNLRGLFTILMAFYVHLTHTNVTKESIHFGISPPPPKPYFPYTAERSNYFTMQI